MCTLSCQNMALFGIIRQIERKQKTPILQEVSRRVPGAGLEPARYYYQWILSP